MNYLHERERTSYEIIKIPEEFAHASDSPKYEELFFIRIWQKD